VDLTLLEKLVQSPFLWSILCLVVAIVYYRKNESEVQRLRKQSDTREKSITKLYEDHKKESNLREEKLMTHLERTTVTLEHIEKGLSKLENKIDGGFKEIWEQIDTLKKGEDN
jgi:predicted Holliday junction resolvase-like endonuclease